MQLRANVLGRIELLADGRTVAVGGPRQRRLLGVLLVHVGNVVPTYRLIDAVWAGTPPSAAERTFRSYVARLRRSLDDVGIDGSEVLTTAPSGYSLSPCVEVDAAAFEVSLDKARRRFELGDPTAARRHVEQALECWKGTPFAEFTDEEWAAAEAIRLEELHLVATELAVEIALELGTADAAIADGRRLVELQPLRERPHHLLMLSLYRSGREAEALRVAREYSDRLRVEAGLQPSRAFTELEHRILEQDPGLEQRQIRSVRGYQLGDVLASGPDAAMHHARRDPAGDEMILIAVAEHVADDVKFIHEFELGARRRAAIRLPGLVPWLDYWREPGAAYVVTGLPSGGSLRHRLTAPDGPPIETLAGFVEDIGETLACLHDAGIVYGELTVDDVWFERGRPVLVGPVPGTARRAQQRDDVIAFAALTRELVSQGRLATGQLTSGATERLEWLLGSAGNDAFDVDMRGLVAEILWLLDAGGAGATVAAVANPYRGLEAFDERHAPFFFGRRSAVDELDREVREHGFVAVVGPSGSGKSSVVRAGLVPRVRADGWLTTVMQPGARPLTELGLALEAISTVEIEPNDDPRQLAQAIGGVVGREERLLLVIDQFEELWTISDSEQRNALLTAIDQLAHQEGFGLHVVVTLRADYLGQALDHQVTGALLRDHAVLLAPMTSVELAEAIVEPARAVGVTVETELVAAIVAEAGRSEGSLPLVQFALTELFEQRDHDALTLEAYRQIGGLAGVIAQRAEDTFARLSLDEQRAARFALTRLVSVDSFGDPTRRRLPNAELAASASGVVTAFGRARLLTFDRDRSTREQVVEIAHESLAREWPRLRSWIAADRESLLVLRRLSAAASTWAASGRDPTDLYRGARLEATEEWANAHLDRLTATESEFLRESHRQAEATRRSERRRTKRLRALTVGLAIALVAVMAAGVVAVVQRGRAVTNADDAARRTVEATSQRLSTQAVDALDIDPDLAILLALEAVRRTEAAGLPPTAGAVEALHTATQSSRLLARWPQSSLSALSPRGERATLVTDDGELVVVDVSTGARLARTQIDGDVLKLRYHPDGDRIVAATTSRLVALNALDLSTLASENVECCIAALEFHPDGDLLAADFGEAGDRVRTWTLDGLRAVRTIDGGRLAGWIGDDVVVFDRSSARRVGSVGPGTDLDVPMEPLLHVDVHPNGRLLVADDEGVAIWSTSSPDALEPVALDGWGVLFQALALGPTGDAIVAFGPSDEVRWQSIDGAHSRSLRGHPSVVSVSVDAGGRRLLASGLGETLLWDLSVEGPAELGALAVDGDVWAIEFSDDGSVVYVADEGGDGFRTRAIDVATRAALGNVEFGAAGDYVNPSITRTALAAGFSPDGTARVVDLTTGEVVADLGRCQVPAAIDADARWLLTSGAIDGLDEACESQSGHVLDPRTGDLLLELPERTGLADIGPPGTISDGLVAYQVLDPGRHDTPIIVRDLRSGDLIGRLDDTTAWRPFFSNDGRHLAFGSWSDGGFAIDMQLVLDGASLDDATVLNPRVEGATTFSVVLGDQLVTGHAGQVLRFWDLADGRPQLELPVSSGDSTFIAPSPDDDYLYYEDEGNLVRRFPVDLDELVELAERRLQRDLRLSECERYRLSDDCERLLASR